MIATDLGHDGRLSAARLATEYERFVATRNQRVGALTRLLVLLVVRLGSYDVVSDEPEDVVAAPELATAIAAHGQMLDDLDDSRLEQAGGAGLRQTALGRTTDQPLQLVAQRVAEMLCNQPPPTHSISPSITNFRFVFQVLNLVQRQIWYIDLP